MPKSDCFSYYPKVDPDKIYQFIELIWDFFSIFSVNISIKSKQQIGDMEGEINLI